MAATMTRKERMLTAMRGGVPDRVPAAPDTNWMIPARLVGGPFWNVYFYGDPPIWKAYNDCVRHFGVDGFSHHGVYHLPPHPDVTETREIIGQTAERLTVRHTFRCPKGELTSEEVFLHDQPPTPVKKYITDFEAQYGCLEYLLGGDVAHISFDEYEAARADLGDDGVIGLCMNLPTLLTHWRQPVEDAFYDYYDHHDLLAAFIKRWTERLVEIAQAVIDRQLRPDFIFFPNSGMITLQSVDILREFSLPALKKLTRMFKAANILTSLHCCGKERALVEIAAKETDLDCIDPLEVPPMGDCNLREIKEKFGRRLALKGNLHTTEVMLRMSPDGVEREARKCLDAAMEGGGFILSTGDQCGRDTPDENIFRLVEVCEKYGRYGEKK
jgi:uroporphyrinogen decarboxylase